MKKIGIITFSRAQNYGATLQCIALQKILSELVDNSEIKVIDYRNKYVEKSYKIFNVDKSNIKKMIRSFGSSIIFFKRNLIRNIRYKKFISNNINLTNQCFSKDQIEKITEDYDIVIVGSDQVWNDFYSNGVDDIYFLNFNTPAKKIAFSVSLGFNKMTNTKVYKYLLENIDSISVREEDGCRVVSKILNKNIKNTLDPTLLIEKMDWLKYIDKRKLGYKYIFAYVPGNLDGYEEFVNFVSNKLNEGVINLRKKDFGIENLIKNVFTSTPDEFLNYIYYSDIVVTTSFHAVVFSILFEKKFWVLAPKENSSRIDNLLEKIDLSNRSIDCVKSLEKKDLLEEIDYNAVNLKLQKLKQDSLVWLKQNLERK